MPTARRRRKYQSMDFQVGFINKAIRVELAKPKPNGRYVIELLDRLALIDSNYDVLALRGHKPPDAAYEVEEDEVPKQAPQSSSKAVDQMLKKIGEEKRDERNTSAADAEDSAT
jgi:hypothetical protein